MITLPTYRACRHEPTGQIIAARVRLAGNFLTRLRGLLGEKDWERQDGLLIKPCNSVHTLGMAFPIGVVFLAADGTIVHLLPAMPPWRLGPLVWPARMVLELPVPLPPMQPGERLIFEPPI